MNALSSISPDIVKLTVAIYTYVEIPLHLIDLPASILFGVVFWRLRSTHLNLRLIFASFVAASFITSAFRLWYCLQLIVLRFDSTADVLHSIANLRTSAIYATGLHLLLLASERQMATSRSDTYEKTTHITAVITFVVLMWLFSFAVTYSLDRQFAKYFVIAFTFVPVYTVSIGMMVRVRRTNFALWKKQRGSMTSSKNFQVRENVVSARYLHKCFVVFVSIATVGWTGLIIYLFFRSVYKVPILEKFFGFVFDIAVALLAMAVVLTITIYNGKLRTQLRRRLKMCCSNDVSSNTGPSPIYDLEGRSMEVQRDQETTVYFDQIRSAWT
ncbi:hypothetical protein Q1695_013591 [Nippostrongylus brasiliensis]|nr:hypothetical protein Q1695_013591 [Nippostrongylus brasiliensis]